MPTPRPWAPRTSEQVDYQQQQFTPKSIQLVDAASPRNANFESGYNQRLAAVAVPPECAKSWTVTLQALEYEGIAITSGVRFGEPTAAGAPAAGDEVGLQVEITWGTAGAIHVARVDYPTKGSTFRLHADSINVDLRVPPTAVSLDVGVQQHIVHLRASIVPANAGTANPRSTRFYGLLLPTESRVQTIPRFARKLRWTTSINTHPSLVALGMRLRQFADQAGAVVLALEKFTCNSSSWPNGGWWLVHPEAAFLEVSNLEVAGSGLNMQPQLEYELDLG